jgi:ligand-binding sensor domain-containing protein
MYFKRFFYFFVFFTFFSVGLSAQEYFFDVEIINVEQGLPSRRTYSVVQDLDGFIWVSTPGKISRYDGYNFRNYTSDRLKINESLPTFLAVDDAGLLWYCEYPSYSITNETGIIDTKINKIQNIEIFSKGLIKGDAVSKISNSDVSAAILIETKNGIIYSYESGEFSVVFKFEEPYAAKIPCALKEFEKGVYWIGKGSDLYKIEGEQIMEQIYVPHNIIDIEPFKKTYVIKTLTSTDRKLWKLENKKVIPFSMNNLNEPNLTHVQNTFNNHYFLCSDKIIFKNKANQIIYEHDNIAQIAILENKSLKLQNLFIDRQNIHWLTTENGLIKVTIQKNHFQVLERKNSIRGIYEDKNDLWIGGYFKNISGSETDELSKILTKNSVAMVGFTKDKSGDLWIGTTADLLLKYDKKKKIFEQFSQGSNALLLPYYNSQLEKIFIGQENGISVYDLKTKRISSKKLPINSDAVEVRQFLEKENDVWIVSSKGLLVMNKQTGDIYNHFSKEDGFLFENFNHLHIDKRGVFWIGTRGNGLIRWNRNNNKIKVFSRENGLSNNNIYAVYEDDFNSLWLPTDYGLNRFNKSTFETRTFLPKDGIAHEEFNTFSHFKDKNGRLYFGGLSGITTFHPKDFTKFQYRPILEVISIEKLGQDELFSEEILEEYNREKTIKLNYNNQNLSFNLALLDFMNPEDNQYAYRLNGINNKWIYTENNVISFNNLPSGRYRLSLKAKGALGNYSDKMLSIPIIIKPPFYKELWFLISSFLVFVVSVYLLFRLRIKRLEIDRIRLETEVAKRTDTILKQTEELKALDKVKTQFFSNITHEFRTPLTLIIGPLEQLLNSKIQGETKEKVKGIHRNANQLRDLINQLLDLSKIESGKMKIELTHGDIINYTKELTENFRFLAEYKNQTLQFISDLEIWETNFDKEKWHKIVIN